MTATAPFDAVALEAARRRLTAGDRHGAAVLLEEALAQAPGHVALMVELGRILLPAEPKAAAALMRRATTADPRALQAWNLFGEALSASGQHDEARTAFTRAVDLAPGDCAVLTNLAIAQLRAGDPHAAIATAQRAIAIDPGHPLAHAGLGHALNILQRSAEAREAFARALAIDGEDPEILRGMATALVDMGRPSWAVLALLRAQARAPQSRAVTMALAQAWMEAGDLAAARSVRRKASGMLTDERFGSNALMCMQYDPGIDEADATRVARAWGAQAMARAGHRPAPVRAPVAGRRLRIGYVSADFYRHPVGWLGCGAIMAHDRSRVHVTAYASQTCRDDLTHAIEAAVDSWVPVHGIDDDTLAARIEHDRIDVLIDLSGHTAGNRLGAFARRPAPVQASWLGYFATTGLPAIDHVLLDAAHVVPGAQALFVETIVTLPGCRFTYLPPVYAPEVAPPPVLRRGRITFGSFNRGAKINAEVIALWARILAAVQPSELLLKWKSFVDPIVQAGVQAQFAACGIDPQRIRFAGHSTHPAMLADYGEIDIALDPFPFCGGLTSCEALWMGVPVVTLPGTRVVSRQTHSVLHAIGHGWLSAPDADRYVAIAAGLAADPERLAALRPALRAAMRASPMGDYAGFACNLEAIYAGWMETAAQR